MGKTIEFFTSNRHKVDLANVRLNKYGLAVKQVDTELRELQDIDMAKVARDKTNQVIAKTRKPFIIEDSGMYIKALNNFPDALFKPVFDTLGERKFIGMLGNSMDRRATLISILAYCNPATKKVTIFEGVCNGKIPKRPKGKNIRGARANRVFMPWNWNKTLAQLNDAEWEKFLDRIKKDDHYEKFGKWLKSHG